MFQVALICISAHIHIPTLKIQMISQREFMYPPLASTALQKKLNYDVLSGI